MYNPLDSLFVNISHSNSMAHEFYQIMVGAPTMSLYSWKQLARWSLEYSCLSPAEQIKGREYLDDSWKDFCQKVVEQYGGLMAGDDIDEAEAKNKYPKRLATS